MIMSLFRKNPARDDAIALYSAMVEQARDAAFYERYEVADSVEGRFELIALHVFLAMRALKGKGQDARQLSEAMVEVMFQNLDDGLREMGVGDLAVGRKIRKLAENYYGRVGVYDAALEGAGAGADEPADGPDALATAISRNVYEREDAPFALGLAAYVRAASAAVEACSFDDLRAGKVEFPDPEKFHG